MWVVSSHATAVNRFNGPKLEAMFALGGLDRHATQQEAEDSTTHLAWLSAQLAH